VVERRRHDAAGVDLVRFQIQHEAARVQLAGHVLVEPGVALPGADAEVLAMDFLHLAELVPIGGEHEAAFWQVLGVDGHGTPPLLSSLAQARHRMENGPRTMWRKPVTASTSRSSPL